MLSFEHWSCSQKKKITTPFSHFGWKIISFQIVQKVLAMNKILSNYKCKIALLKLAQRIMELWKKEMKNFWFTFLTCKNLKADLTVCPWIFPGNGEKYFWTEPAAGKQWSWLAWATEAVVSWCMTVVCPVHLPKTAAFERVSELSHW